jgi:hypothetical protein
MWVGLFVHFRSFVYDRCCKVKPWRLCVLCVYDNNIWQPAVVLSSRGRLFWEHPPRAPRASVTRLCVCVCVCVYNIWQPAGSGLVTPSLTRFVLISYNNFFYPLRAHHGYSLENWTLENWTRNWNPKKTAKKPVWGLFSQLFLFCEGAVLIWPIMKMFFEPCTLTIRSSYLDLQLQILSLHPPFQFIHVHESWALGKAYGINLRCYWECLGGTTWGTWWEHIGNEETKQTISPSPPFLP